MEAEEREKGLTAPFSSSVMIWTGISLSGLIQWFQMAGKWWTLFMCVLFPSGCVYIYLLSIYKDRYLSLCEYVFNQAFKFMVCIIEILSFSFLCPPRARLIFLLKGMFSPFLLLKLSGHLLSQRVFNNFHETFANRYTVGSSTQNWLKEPRGIYSENEWIKDNINKTLHFSESILQGYQGTQKMLND